MWLFAPASSVWTSRLLALLRIVIGIVFLMSAEMAVAYWQVHNPVSPFLTASGGMPAAILCFTLLYMSAAGSGDWSIHGVISRTKRGAPL